MLVGATMHNRILVCVNILQNKKIVEEYVSEVNILDIKSPLTPAVTSYNFVSLLPSSGTGETTTLASRWYGNI
jgi:hypothetical protein